MNEQERADAILHKVQELRAKVAVVEREVYNSLLSPTAMAKARQLCPDMVELAVKVSNLIDEEL
jgi:hypothetical protein